MIGGVIIASFFPSSKSCPNVFTSQLYTDSSLQLGDDLLVRNGLTRLIFIHDLRLLVDSLQRERGGEGGMKEGRNEGERERDFM